LPQAVELVVERALANQRRQEICLDGLEFRKAAQGNDLLGPCVVVNHRAVEIEDARQFLGQGRGVDLVAVAALRQCDQVDLDLLL
jgi:hypothetical protein